MLKQQIYILVLIIQDFDKIFTRDDLLKYDAQNTGGGNFYI